MILLSLAMFIVGVVGMIVGYIIWFIAVVLQTIITLIWRSFYDE